MTAAGVLMVVFGVGPPRSPISVREWQRAGDAPEEYIDTASLVQSLTDVERMACRLRYGQAVTREVVRYEWGESGPEAMSDRRATLLPFDDIAKAMGLSPRQVRRHLNAATDKVRKAQSAREYTHVAKR